MQGFTDIFQVRNWDKILVLTRLATSQLVICVLSLSVITAISFASAVGNR